MNQYHHLMINAGTMLGLMVHVCDRLDWHLSPEERQVLSLHCSAGSLIREALDVAEDLDADLSRKDSELPSVIAEGLAKRILGRTTTYIHMPTPHFSPRDWSHVPVGKEETI